MKKKYYFFIAIVFLLPFFYSFFVNNKKNDFPYLEISEAIIKVEIADTSEKHYLGLSKRLELCPDCGMIFVFKNNISRQFVMRNMEFPLDIIWIDDNEIIGIEKNLVPEGVKPKNIYNSKQEVNYVLEVNGGFCENNNIKVGDKIKFKNF